MADIHDAAYGGNIEWLSRLLDAGVSIEARDPEGDSPLILAACFWPAATRFLLERGADLRAVSNYGSSALHSAVYWGRAEIVELLLAAGLDAAALDAPDNALGRTGLESGSRATVELLLRAGVAFDRVGPDGRTTVEAAFAKLDRGAAKLALELGWIEPQQAIGGESAWSRAMAARDVAALVAMVVDRGANPEVRGGDGVSCLHLAIRAGDRVAFEALRARGADLAATTYTGATLWTQVNGTSDRDWIDALRSIAPRGTKPLDWAWDAGRRGPHLVFSITTPGSTGPALGQSGEDPATADYAEDATGIAIIRYWGGGASYDREIREFLAGHRDAAWAITYGGDGYTPGTIAHGNDAASLEAYLNLDTPG
jgi:ankyrin repeat protein